MGEYAKGLVVTLHESVREEVAEEIANLCLNIKGVIAVDPILDTYEDKMNRNKVKHDVRQKIVEILDII